MPEIERRAQPLVEAQVTGRTARWRPIVYESASRPLSGGAFVEVIGRGAATKTLQENRSIVALFNHDPSMTLGSIRGSTLTLTEDRDGVLASCLLPESRSDVLELIRRGDAGAASFSFEAIREDWRPGEPPVRHIQELRLHEVSILSMAPAYAATEGQVSLRAVAEARSLVGGGDAWTPARRRAFLEDMERELGAPPSEEQPKRKFWFFPKKGW